VMGVIPDDPSNKNGWIRSMANPAIKKGEILPEGYRKRRLYTKEVEHLGQIVTESDNANAQTGIAKNRTIRIIMIRSENFFLFMLPTLPFSPR
jgi:hypothetical protein